VFRGDDREKTVLWGRWKLHNVTSGLYRGVTLVADAPVYIYM